MKYSIAVRKGKGFLLKITTHEKQAQIYRIKLAELAVKICDGESTPEERIKNNGGADTKHGNKVKSPYSYSKFAKDIGMSSFNLINYIGLYKNVYKKADITKKGKKLVKLSKKQKTALNKVARKVTAKTSVAKVNKLIKIELKKNKETKRLENHIKELQSLHRFLIDHNISALDKTLIQDIRKMIKVIGKELNIKVSLATLRKKA